MKIDKYEKIGKDKYRLYLSNGEVIDTYDNVILDNELLLKSELDNSLYNRILNETNFYDKYNIALNYIRVRLRSTKEIKEYLLRKKIEKEDIELIVDKLTKTNNLNDDYFSKCFIKDKFRFTSWGPYRIKQELKKLGIDDELINNNITIISEEEIDEKLDKLINKQIKSNHKKLDDYKFKNKIYTNLVKLGYDASYVINILNEYL
ncbi:MAG: RecX family transcriptional regulator [Bacilli bacterium]|nr:RecX family transcriptional regulator [Bacilli bacterium]